MGELVLLTKVDGDMYVRRSGQLHYQEYVPWNPDGSGTHRLADVLEATGDNVHRFTEYGVRWHDRNPASENIGVDEKWYSDPESARRRADLYGKDSATPDDPEWCELIRRTVITIYGPAEIVPKDE